MRKRHLWIAVLSIICVVLLGADMRSERVQAQSGGRLVVFAAASLTDAFTDLARQFEAVHPESEVLLSFGGSSSLAAQIYQGAPADVFASANHLQMIRLQDEGLLATYPRTFARNRLALIVPADNPANIMQLGDVAQADVRLVVAAEGVPVRVYSDVLVSRLSQLDAYGVPFAEGFYSNIVSEEDNVRQVALKVALGEADAGLVYASDVTADIADDVLIIPLPDSVNPVATYPIAVLAETNAPELAHAFVDFVQSEHGQMVIQDRGLLSGMIQRAPITINR